MIQVFVPSAPQPQGSKVAFNRGGRCVLVESNKKLPAWRKLVTEKLEAANAGCEPMIGEISLQVIFFMPRPKSVTRLFPTVKPDIDKLIRAINDSATDAGIIEDDSQIIEIVAYKFYEDEQNPVGAFIAFDKLSGVSAHRF
jgi:Holliday junction resolvase RusA-like endonuclease